MDQKNDQNQAMQPDAASPQETAAPRRRRSAIYQQEESAASSASGTAGRSVPVSGASGMSGATGATGATGAAGIDVAATQTMPPIRSSAQRNEQKQGNTVSPVPNVLRRDIPSQGIPQPGQSQSNRSLETGLPQPKSVNRRPVKLEGMENVKSPAQRQQEAIRRTSLTVQSPNEQERNQHLQQEIMREQDDYDEENEPKKGKGILTAVVIIVMVLALCVLGLILVPDDDTGVLGTIKQSVMTPLNSLFNRDSTQTVEPTASGFTASITSAVSPYQITFNLVTSSNVTDVRVVADDGTAFDTTTLMMQVNSDNTIIWIFTLTTIEEYSGTIEAEILSNETWVKTGLRQTMNLGGNQPATISTLPTSYTATISSNPTDVDGEELTAGLDPEPTVSASSAEIMTAVPVVVVTDAPTETPTLEPTDIPTELPTATPPIPMITIANTELPTLTPTVAPTEDIAPVSENDEDNKALVIEVVETEAPTEVPTEAPTEAPTATPTPMLVFEADASADPALIANTVVYQGTSRTAVENYERPEDEVISMPAGDDYTTRKIGVLTYRGNAFRQNAAVGTVDDASQLSVLWTVETGSLKGKSKTYYGFSWGNQPVIEQWARTVRQDMTLLDGKSDKTALKEVIAASLDGKIYFLDLDDGSQTREPINLGYPIRSTPSLSALAYPMMTVGQYARKLATKTGDIGQHFYDLLTNKENLTIDGLDGGSKKDRAYYQVGAFDGSALYDRNSDTYIIAGTNGMLYTVHMNTSYQKLDDDSAKLSVNPTTTMMKSRTKNQKNEYVAVESSIAMYGSHVFYADLQGVLRCVDTTTMSTVWAVETGDAVKASIALDFDEDGHLWLYTANTLCNRSKNGDVTIRRYNAQTGKEDWSYAVNAAKKKNYVSGAMASPVIGQYELDDLVYYTLSYLTESGSQSLMGSSAEVQSGVLIALNKETGKVVWTKSLGSYSYSSPVAVYNEDGKGWIIQATSNGVLMLLDGLTGETLNTLQLNGTIDASPAVYQNILVIGTTGKDTSFLYGIKID